MFGRRKLAALVAEFLGVAVITLVILAVNKSGVGFSYFLATGAGLALALLIVALGRFSIGHYNPAVTLGLWSIRKINTLDSIAYIAAQFLGASVAWRLYMYLANTDLKNIAGKHQLDWRVFTAEAIGALILVTVVAAAVYHNFRTLKWALAAGGGLFLGMLISSLGSNGIVNPAVALGLQSWAPIVVSVLVLRQ
jgi:glycerol uptake facilitator protein